jgi:hypothetical protein
MERDQERNLRAFFDAAIRPHTGSREQLELELLYEAKILHFPARLPGENSAGDGAGQDLLRQSIGLAGISRPAA